LGGENRVNEVQINPLLNSEQLLWNSKMLQFLEALASNHRLVAMRLDATLNAAPFYRRCGWSGDSVSTYRTSHGLELACVPMTKRVIVGD
jgi:hypothetical protein